MLDIEEELVTKSEVCRNETVIIITVFREGKDRLLEVSRQDGGGGQVSKSRKLEICRSSTSERPNRSYLGL